MFNVVEEIMRSSTTDATKMGLLVNHIHALFEENFSLKQSINSMNNDLIELRKERG